MQDLLAGLNDQQRDVVQATHGPVLVLAGAGSGKTRALTHRIAYLIQQKIARPQEVLAVTFTNKAAGEMKERVAHLLTDTGGVPASIGTFHSLGAKMLREQAGFLPRSHGFSIFDTADSERVVRLAMEHLQISKKEYSPKQIKSRLSHEKSAGRLPHDVAEAAGSAQDEVLAAVWARYEKLMAKYDAYDFDDLIIEPLRLLEEQPQVRRGYQQAWRWISVDEYQDTNPPQEQWLRLLTGPEKHICVVGDDYQAIYSWRGANVDHILQFEQTYPDCRTIYLTRNYRSTPTILSAANAVISKNIQQKHKELWTKKQPGEPVRVVTLPSSQQEAVWVRQQLEAVVDSGGKRNDCVVLYRTNAQSRVLEEEFLTHQIPYTIVGGFRFYERKEVKDALAFLQLWVNPMSSIALARIADVLFSGVGPKTLHRWELLAEEEKRTLREVLMAEAEQRRVVQAVAHAYSEVEKGSFETVSKVLELLLAKSGYERWLKKQADGEERWENIEELLHVTSGYSDVRLFLEDVALLSDLDQLESEQDRITCMTLHAAKGLEYRYVFLVGLEDGLLPHKNSVDTQAELEEERRLLYVGMTRAQEGLVLTHARSRFMYGELVPQIPSRFLEALPESVERHEIESSNYYQEIISPAAGDETDPVMVDAEEGDFVAHAVFGRGVVISIAGSTLTCVFEGYGVKQVSADGVRSHEV